MTCWERLRELREQDENVTCKADCEYCMRHAEGGCSILHMLNCAGVTSEDQDQVGTFKLPSGDRIQLDGMTGSTIAHLCEQSKAAISQRINRALDRMWYKMGAHGVSSEEAEDWIKGVD